MTDVVSMRIYMVDYRPEQADLIGSVLREFFPQPARPTTTWLGISTLALPEFLIEIEAFAVLD